MAEKQFNTEIVNSIKHWGGYAHKLADTPASMIRGLRFVGEKPCDILGGYAGNFFAIESKQIKKFEAFGKRHLRDGQIRELEAIAQAGCRAFVVLNIRIKAVKGKQKRENRVVIFPWQDFRRLTRSIRGEDLKTLPYVSCQRVDGQVIYDLKPFLEGLRWANPKRTSESAAAT